MNTTKHFRSQAYLDSVRLLHELHFLMRDGQDEKEEGSGIREAMEEPWYAMTEAEQDRIRGMSADLYTLETESPVKHSDAVGFVDLEFEKLLTELVQRDDWERVLELLRDQPQRITWSDAATLRAKAYRSLGDFDTAELFRREAARLSSVMQAKLAL